MTGLVGGLERQGFIKRKPLASSRVIEATVTAQGRRIFDEATLRVEEIETQMTSLLSDTEVGQLRSVLERCVDSLERGAGKPLEMPDEEEPLEQSG